MSANDIVASGCGRILSAVMDRTSGCTFLTDELDLGHGITVGINRVHRLCRVAGITPSDYQEAQQAKFACPAPHDDLLTVVDEHGAVRHEFIAYGPNNVWVWDISEYLTPERMLRICAVKDVFSSKVSGYSIGSRMKSSLARSAMRNAVLSPCD